MNLINEVKQKMLHSGSRLYLFIGINIIVFLLINIILVVEFLFGRQTNLSGLISEQLSVPTNLNTLLMRFWSPITYMFMHSGVLHILFNMLWLYWMGRIFEEYLGTKKLTFIYFAGGLAGAFFYILCYNLLPAFTEVAPYSSAVGASAAVTAIVIATATLLPDYTIFLLLIGPVKLKWIAVIYIVLDFISLAGPNAGGHLTHLGGALLGFFYIKSLQNGNDWNKPFERLFSKKKKLKVVPNTSNQHQRKAEKQKDEQEIIDEILDKISKSGYESLTKKEKETLFKVSNKE